MKLNEYLKTWEGLQIESWWQKVANLGLILALIILGLKVYSKEEIVTIQPFTLDSEEWVSSDNSSAGYKKAWGFALAQLFGNVTPGSAEFVKEKVEPLLAPQVYSEAVRAIERQAAEIRRDRVSFQFEPRQVEYERSSNKVFVYGNSVMRGSSMGSREERSQRTYEFVIEIARYMPLITFVDTYEGRPRTKRIRDRMERMEVQDED